MPRDDINSTFVLHCARIEVISGYHKWCPGMVWISTFASCFTRIEATSGDHKRCWGIVSIQRLYNVSRALRRHQGTMIDVEGWYRINYCIVFYTHWGDIRSMLWWWSGCHDRCREMVWIQRLYRVLHALRRHLATTIDAKGWYKFTFASCVTCIEVTSGHHDFCWGMVWIPCLYGVLHASRRRQGTWLIFVVEYLGMVRNQCLCCVSHALRRHQGSISDSEGWCQLNVCIVCYMCWGDMRVPWFMPRDCINSTFVWCFTCIEVTSGYDKSLIIIKWCPGIV